MRVAVWFAFALCVVIGLTAGIGRAIYMGGYAQMLEPSRQRLIEAVGRRDPPGTDRAAIVRGIDGKFAKYPTSMLLHVVAGSAYLLLASLQIVRRIRTRYPRFHRWNGRVLLIAGMLIGLTGFFFGIGMPYAGPGEATVVAIVGALFLFSLGRAYVAIRRKDVAVHREWMLRALGVGLGISVVRLVAAVYDVAFIPTGASIPFLFVASLWTGWAIAIGGTEWWIRRTRPATLAVT